MFNTLEEVFESEVYQEALEEAETLEATLKELYERLNKATVQTNLKLHEAAYIANDPEEFNFFCEQKFNEFEDLLEALNLNMKHVGSTSSFYLISEGSLEFFYRFKNDYYTENSLENFISELMSAVDLPEYLEYRSIKEYTEYIFEEYQEDLEDILEDTIDFISFFYRNWYRDLEEAVSDVEEGYKYIEDFKKDQVNIYKEFTLETV